MLDTASGMEMDGCGSTILRALCTALNVCKNAPSDTYAQMREKELSQALEPGSLKEKESNGIEHRQGLRKPHAISSPPLYRSRHPRGTSSNIASLKLTSDSTLKTEESRDTAPAPRCLRVRLLRTWRALSHLQHHAFLSSMIEFPSLVAATSRETNAHTVSGPN